jgi:hypothetical protein
MQALQQFTSRPCELLQKKPRWLDGWRATLSANWLNWNGRIQLTCDGPHPSASVDAIVMLSLKLNDSEASAAGMQYTTG